MFVLAALPISPNVLMRRIDEAEQVTLIGYFALLTRAAHNRMLYYQSRHLIESRII